MTMNKLALATAATAVLCAGAPSPAYAGSNLNGPQLTGIALQSLASNQPVVTAVTLPSGETVDLRPDGASVGQGEMTVHKFALAAEATAAFGAIATSPASPGRHLNGP